MGNLVGDGSRSFGYNARGRLNSATVGGVTTTYTINALGQRVKKATGAVVTIFVYDEAGQLLGEYDGSGNQIAEHIYLDGLPVAVMKFVAGNPKVYQVYPDHLGTPRAVVDPAVAQPAWQWHNVDPFGGNLPNENPAGLGTFKYNLRFPGQYYDAETGLHYNYFRDYDASIGRYVESDPVGLKADINTYLYVRATPINIFDPSGLQGMGTPERPPPGAPQNGNIWPGYSKQNNVCDFPFGDLNFTSCTKNCCIEHDECYARYKCNWSSWGGNLGGAPYACNKCNSDAYRCILANLTKTGCPPPGQCG
jgi:RHS repeat-associated protein